MPLPLTPSQSPAPDPLCPLRLRLLSHRDGYEQYGHQAVQFSGNMDKDQFEGIGAIYLNGLREWRSISSIIRDEDYPADHCRDLLSI